MCIPEPASHSLCHFRHASATLTMSGMRVWYVQQISKLPHRSLLLLTMSQLSVVRANRVVRRGGGANHAWQAIIGQGHMDLKRIACGCGSQL